MSRKKNNEKEGKFLKGAHIEAFGVIQKQPITSTLEQNYMPYAMSVILSRALPQIDGFKPSHRKLLYTMYKMGLLKGKLTKSANIVGATMKLNPHGDSAIYETMVRLSRGYEALLHPFVESKGNFGKFYSRDMAYAASRYTEAKLSSICEELFSDIDKNSVDFVPNYDNSTTEPVLLPIRFPSILVNSNIGIAVSMASSICPFNLAEVCKATIKLIKKEKFKLIDILKGPDFPGGGFLIKDEPEFLKIYETGRGSFKIRSRYYFDKTNNCIDITEIPYTTTVESIIDKIVSLIKNNKIKEISDIRDETDLNGLKITIDLKRGVNAKNLMNKLFKYTPLEDSYACNFNVLVNGVPKVMGIKDIIYSWQKFRQVCVKRRTEFELKKKQKKLHLLKALNKILLDIDEAIEIIKKTKKEEDVVSNLMAGFNIDKLQAEYIAEIKLRHLNRQYILDRLKENDELIEKIKELEDILKSDSRINDVICNELEEIISKYEEKRRTMFLYKNSEYDPKKTIQNEDYLVNLFITKEGYLKKITSQSLRQSKEQKLKEDDEIYWNEELYNDVDILFFTNKGRMFRANLSVFPETKASSFGEYLPANFKFEEDEKIIQLIYTKTYEGSVIFFYENGKVSRIDLSSYKTNRKKLSAAFSKTSSIVSIFYEASNSYYMLKTNSSKSAVIYSNLLDIKTKRDSAGLNVFSLKKGEYVNNVEKLKEIKGYEELIYEKIPVKGRKFKGQIKLGE